eukprot:TRINITY_DN8806_c0_g1_i4.p1 TRINITY_DN8806_c0_g1~~TRINITY_DN8806_c0_g1_i4.p1  ORF type:complete len:111 (-),score=9.56 TRINITY_DN8806_c0_g1_i4:179-511(-)
MNGSLLQVATLTGRQQIDLKSLHRCVVFFRCARVVPSLLSSSVLASLLFSSLLFSPLLFSPLLFSSLLFFVFPLLLSPFLLLFFFFSSFLFSLHYSSPQEEHQPEISRDS